MEVWIGTTNKGKLNELASLFGKEFPQIAIKSLSDLPASYSQPPENGTTFLENARIKARSLKAMQPGKWVLAEDSGIEVFGLNGLPGIHSARYAGAKAADSENIAKLLKMMQIRNVTDRSARFICVVVAYDPAGEEYQLTGELKGQIAKLPAGNLGFGYDPIFIAEGQTQTLAQLGPGFKLQTSHRSQAARQLIPLLQKSLS